MPKLQRFKGLKDNILEEGAETVMRKILNKVQKVWFEVLYTVCRKLDFMKKLR